MSQKSRAAAAAVPFYCRPVVLGAAMAIGLVVALAASAASPSGDVEVVEVPADTCPVGLMTGWECRTNAAIEAAMQ